MHEGNNSPLLFFVKLDTTQCFHSIVESDAFNRSNAKALKEHAARSTEIWNEAVERCLSEGQSTIVWKASDRAYSATLSLVKRPHMTQIMGLLEIDTAFANSTAPINKLLASFATQQLARHDKPSLLEEFSRVKTIMDAINDSFFILDSEEMKFIEANEGALGQLGYKEDEIHSMNPGQLFPQYSNDKVENLLSDFKKSEDQKLKTRTVVMKAGGEVFDSEIVFSKTGRADERYIALFVSDITLCEQANEELRKANRTLRILSSIGKRVMGSKTEKELIETILWKLVSESEFLSVYCVVKPEDAAQDPQFYQSEINEGDFEESSSDFEAYDSIKENFYRKSSKECEVFRNKPQLTTLANGLPSWKAPKFGACAILPLINEAKSIGSIAIFAKGCDAFDEDELKLLGELASEFAFGIITQRRERGRLNAEDRIARKLKVESAISTFSNALLKSPEFVGGVKKALPNLARASGADHVFLYKRKEFDQADRSLIRLCGWVKPGIRTDSDVADSFTLNQESEQWLNQLRFRKHTDQFASKLPPDIKSYLNLKDSNRLLAFPLNSGEHIFGFIGFCLTKSKRTWDKTIYKMLSISANLIEELYNRVKSDREMKMLATAINNSDEGVIISDGDSKYNDSPITFVNKGLSLMADFKADELVGETLSKLFKVEISDESIRINQSCRYRAKLKKSNGDEILTEIKVYPVIGANNYILHYITIIVDITQKEEMESKLSFANKMESIGQLSAGIAHEINTPSQFVGDNLYFINNSWDKINQTLSHLVQSQEYERIAKEKEDGALLAPKKLANLISNIPDAISDAVEGSERITSIVKAMKEFSHPEKRMKPGDINKCVQTTITVARNEWKYVSDLSTDLEDNLPMIEFIPGDINQVLLNLIVNAAQAIEEAKRGTNEKGNITITSRLEEDKVRLTIQDNGCGIPEENGRNVFNPFYTTKEVGKGTGQGLFMAHSIIEQKHKGQLWFDSKVGEGTTFYIDLPITSGNDERN